MTCGSCAPWMGIETSAGQAATEMRDLTSRLTMIGTCMKGEQHCGAVEPHATCVRHRTSLVVSRLAQRMCTGTWITCYICHTAAMGVLLLYRQSLHATAGRSTGIAWRESWS